MKVIYFNHSGFLVETENKVLVFDYYSHGKRFDFFDPKDYKAKDIIFFVSHNHSDHFDARILGWAEDAAYVISNDVTLDSAFQGEVLYVKPHETYQFHGLTIETLLSNDEGVAFAVVADGEAIYHGGDLNWWHWNGESQEFNDEIAKSYQDEILKIKGRKFKVAFIPADLRLQDKYAWATDYFMQEVDTDAVFPMHFWGKFDVCQMLKEKPYGDKIMEISKVNEAFTVS